MIRALTVSDAAAYVDLRHEMLTDSPWAFGSSPGQDRMGTRDAVEKWVAEAEGAIVGAFQPMAPGSREALVAAAGIMREASVKRRHIAGIWGVYARPAVRGRGLGRAVVAGAVEYARRWPEVVHLQLSVSDNSPEARRMYESLGFEVWGIEPDCLRIDGRSFAEVHMTRRLDAAFNP